MTILESKSERDSIGIDSFERGLVYATLLLYKAIKDPNNPVPANENPFSDAITFNLRNVANPTSALNVTANFPVDRIEASELGGNYLESLGIFGNTNPNPLDINCEPSSAEFIAILPEPSYVTTLEQYFVWLAHMVKGDLIITNPTTSDVIQTQFINENPDYPRLRINLRLPINYRTYLRSNNLICAVKPILTQPIAPLPDGSGSFSEVGNSDDFGNNNDLGNGGNITPSGAGNTSNVGNNNNFGN